MLKGSPAKFRRFNFGKWLARNGMIPLVAVSPSDGVGIVECQVSLDTAGTNCSVASVLSDVRLV